jgi:hypothetical protein
MNEVLGSLQPVIAALMPAGRQAVGRQQGELLGVTHQLK